MRFVYPCLQVLGIALFAAGLWMQWPWVGVTVFGAGFVLLGFAIERELRTNARQSPQH